ncbi:MAG: hypothetical protein A2504_17510 [Bdellovibrionales bacterium RIFOXYD12_FULL_39_22]|nr:MAG: hypothetical protein A2385_10450 [Bdellovibrionales bacterium RIFOXYB1_FULL_39_21]OFZ40800.1 MAG: hypothetical protein A2485_17280 [Bdellovibrionales bacterium RIFOXYC12_FULL_39_17]OFZ48222.1 MAG: hypothetical protein A2404_17440 [Bdellovibrionales bacterium RIFOXYC1_FULL_39_130]OFZ75872.1 MAG: hypothetical protein A2560_13940 [Bdellovibrionales bacterium RIFOXYD1_FULL_39_84]OFZ91933.1 MAG: hypothetical protein A2504_17510 [Bdellovibrionales bacterium RIFOXYD12_FULL_39_22]HLE11446.1 en
MKKISVLFCATVFNYILAMDTFSVVSMNLEWFGLGGVSSGRTGDEYRIPWMKEFVNNYFANADIIALQEVVDLSLIPQLVGAQYNCISYHHSHSKHQHVVLCLKSEFTISMIDGESDFIFEDIQEHITKPLSVSESNLRPGIFLKASHPQLGEIQIMAVHLKAYADGVNQRMRQIGQIKNVTKNGRWLIVGDFNLQRSDSYNEITMAEEILNTMNRLQGNYQFTYRSGQYRSEFDHMFVSGQFLAGYHIESIGPCNQPQNMEKITGERFEDIRFYNRFVSDHCLIKASIQLF